MIQRTMKTVETKNMIAIKEHVADKPWQDILRDSQIDVTQLLDRLGLDSHALTDSSRDIQFPLRVPAPYLEKIQAGDPNDPLLLQILPQNAENEAVSGYSNDPLEEQHYSPVPGLLHKYPSRVLLVTTQACAIHCRYCFRRNFPYTEHRFPQHAWQTALEYIASNPSVNEVILSGGDPLMLPDDKLHALFRAIDAIAHIKRIRIHSRLISSLPQRITPEFARIFGSLRVKVVCVLHCNHPNELGADLVPALDLLRHHGVWLLNQSVILKGVNDNAETLKQLSETLFDYQIQPYYLFTLDKARGTAHFDLPIEKVKTIYRELMGLLPGFLVPKLAEEIPDRPSKSQVSL